MMECPHCMVEATKDNKDFMEFQTLRNLDLIIKESLTLLVSGGEPTEHPQFYEFCTYLLNRYPNKAVVLLSNGMFINDAYKTQRVKQLLEEKNFNLQITKDKRFYPINVDLSDPLFHSNKVAICYGLTNLLPIGRAKAIVDNHPDLKYVKSVRPCFNYKSNLFGFEYDILKFIKYREYTNLKFCSHNVDAKGNWYFGECFHTPFFNVNDKDWHMKSKKASMDLKINSLCKNCPEIVINS